MRQVPILAHYECQVLQAKEEVMIDMNAPGAKMEVTIDEGGLRLTGHATEYQVETSCSGNEWSFRFGHLEVNNVRNPQVRIIEPELGPDVPWILIDGLFSGTFVGAPAYWSQDHQAYVGVGGRWVGVHFPIGIFDSWIELEEPSFTAKENA